MDNNSTLDLTYSSSYESSKSLDFQNLSFNNQYYSNNNQFSLILNEELFKKYKLIDKLKFENPLSPTILHIVEDKNKIKYAMKETLKSKIRDKYLLELAKNELSIHYSLSRQSNYIVKVHDTYEDDNSFNMVMDLCENPEYFTNRLENKHNPIDKESTLKHFAMNILSALSVIHNNNIIHCDIKPDNFLLFRSENLVESLNIDDELSLNSSDENEEMLERMIKLTDFGLSHRIPIGQSKAYLKFPFGSYGYTAPEIKSNCYVDKLVDIWSFGVCLYQMAVTYKPTSIKKYEYGNENSKLGKGPIPFINNHWKKFDFQNLKNLILSCLRINPEDRITVDEAINHPWFDY